MAGADVPSSTSMDEAVAKGEIRPVKKQLASVTPKHLGWSFTEINAETAQAIWRQYSP